MQRRKYNCCIWTASDSFLCAPDRWLHRLIRETPLTETVYGTQEEVRQEGSGEEACCEEVSTEEGREEGLEEGAGQEVGCEEGTSEEVGCEEGTGT